jgi:molybdate transport system substrate-binding protein
VRWARIVVVRNGDSGWSLHHMPKSETGALRPGSAVMTAGAFAASLALVLALSQPAAAQDKSITVFAAASMTNIVRDLNAILERNTGIKATGSYASSAALARQIEQGAPADIFISADIPWMNYLQERNLIRKKTRFNLASNRLVLIAPKDSALGEQTIGQGFDIAALAGSGRIATGDVKSVPAGRYARTALEKLGSWKAAEPKLAMAENVRAALVLVARGEAPLGIVYATDAAVEPGVKVIGTFPKNSHPPIIYPAAATATAKPEADAYLKLLYSGTALVGLQKYGFTYLPGAGP